MRLRVAFMFVGTFPSLWIAAGHAQDVTSASEVKVTVVDQMGAVIPDTEVSFKSDSKTAVSHTGQDGSVIVTLPSGQYAVTANQCEFVKNEVPGFQVAASGLNELRIVLRVDHAVLCCLRSTGPEIPTTTSDLPNVIEPRLIRDPSALIILGIVPPSM